MGAIRIDGTWRTTAPTQAVWEVLADLETWPQWWPAIRRAEPLGASAAGSIAPSRARLELDAPSGLRPFTIELAVATQAERHHLGIEAVDGPLRGTGALQVDEEAEGSAARFDLRLRVRSLLFKPVELVLARAASNAGADRLRRAGDDLARLAGGEPRAHDV